MTTKMEIINYLDKNGPCFPGTKIAIRSDASGAYVEDINGNTYVMDQGMLEREYDCVCGFSGLLRDHDKDCQWHTK